MKRSVVVGALIVILASIAGPAFAQADQGSVLPPPTQTQVLPAASRPGGAAAVTQQQGAALADTGFELTNGVLLAAVLLGIGASVLAVTRRRAAR